MELEELKNKWKQLDEHVKAQDDKIRELRDQVVKGKVKSPLMTLKRHCIIAAVFVPFLLPFFFWAYDFVGLNCPEWQKNLLYALTWIFVLFTFAREIYFIQELKRINVGRDTAVEALRQTILFRKHYHRGVLIDLILGMILIFVMICSFNKEFIYGGIVGFIIGGCIGYKMYCYYNRAIDELEAAFHEWIE